MTGYGQPVQQQPQPMAAPAGSTVVVAAVSPIINFGAHPARVECPHCHKIVQTTTKSLPSDMAWDVGLGLCLIG